MWQFCLHVLRLYFLFNACFFRCPPTLWSQCGYQPSHCGSRWRWAGWRHSRFSGLPERCVEPFPRPSARESAQSCGRPTQVSDTLACRMHSREGPPALRASLSSEICGCLISEEVCCPCRPQALNVALHHGLFLTNGTHSIWQMISCQIMGLSTSNEAVTAAVNGE